MEMRLTLFLLPTLYFEHFQIHKGQKNDTMNALTSFTQIHQLLPFYHLCSISSYKYTFLCIEAFESTLNTL